MTSTYGAGTYDTETTGSLGIDLSDKEPVVDNDYDIGAVRLNTAKSAIRQLELVLGDGSSTLTSDGDADEYNVREVLDNMVMRADRGFIYDHFLFSAHGNAIFANLVTAATYQDVAGGVGVDQITLGAGLVEGWQQATDLFEQRSSGFRCRWHIDSLPSTVGDVIVMGLRRDATHYILLKSECTNAVGPVWSDFILEIDNGGGAVPQTLTGSAPSAGTWYVAEIRTTAAGATGFIDRAGQGAGTEYTEFVTNAPEDALCTPYLMCTSNVGGELFSCDVMGAGSTVIPL